MGFTGTGRVTSNPGALNALNITLDLLSHPPRLAKHQSDHRRRHLLPEILHLALMQRCS
jgi:hypothetical protein